MRSKSIRIRRKDDVVAGHERFWATVANRLADPRLPTWDVLIVYLHDNGTVLAYPARSLLPFRYASRKGERSSDFPHFEGEADAGVLLQADALGAELAKIDEDGTDAAFERAFGSYIDRRVDLLRVTAARVEDLLTIVDAPRRGAHWVLEADSVHEVVLRPLLGPRLPTPRRPTTCLEVFARLLAAKHSAVYPEHTGLTWKNDDLIEVELEGADVTDEVLDLLGEVDDVAELCPTLERLTLRATRVTKRAIERAKRRLPHVAIRATRALRYD